MSREKLPDGVLQAIILSVDEVKEHLRAGEAATRNQIARCGFLPPVERVRVLEGLKKQLEHYLKSQGSLDYFIAKVQQRMKWPAIIRNMKKSELVSAKINPNLWDAMQWNVESELSKT